MDDHSTVRTDISRTFSLISVRKNRSLHPPGDIAAAGTLATTRFSGVKENLYQRVQGTNFLGYWIFRNSFTVPTSPTESDIVLYYLHGGAYCIYQPGNFLAFLLRVAEELTQHGISVSIFALDYALSPEYPFPTQLSQAVLGYEYLVREMGVSPEKLALLGDSAGANLCLSLSMHLHTPHPGLIPNHTQGLAKPAAAFLISPWVTFKTDHPTYAKFELLDILQKDSLEYLAACFRGPGTLAEDRVLKRYTEFSAPDEAVEWRDVLPLKNWVLAGSVEIFLGNIQQFVELARSGGAEVDLEVGRGLAHDPPVTECMRGSAGYTDAPLEERVGEKVLPVTRGVAMAIAELVKGRRDKSRL